MTTPTGIAGASGENTDQPDIQPEQSAIYSLDELRQMQRGGQYNAGKLVATAIYYLEKSDKDDEFIEILTEGL